MSDPGKDEAAALHRQIYYEGFEAHPCGPADTPCETCDELASALQKAREEGSTREAERDKEWSREFGRDHTLKDIPMAPDAVQQCLQSAFAELRAEVERLRLDCDSMHDAAKQFAERTDKAEAALAEAQAEVEDHRGSMFIPGAQACPVCKFSLQKMVMRASDGAVGVNAAAPLEECPNGCGFLIAVTYEQGWREMIAVAETQASAAAESQKRVERLEAVKVAAYDMLNSYDEAGHDAYGVDAVLCQRLDLALRALAPGNEEGKECSIQFVSEHVWRNGMTCSACGVGLRQIGVAMAVTHDTPVAALPAK